MTAPGLFLRAPRRAARLAAFLAACLGAFLGAAAPAAAQATLTNPVHQFVKAHLDHAQALSIQENREYCGYIGRATDGALVASKATPGYEASCSPVAPIGPDFRPIASYHTHGSYLPAYDNETPSVQDLQSDFSEGVDGYVATPGGRFWWISVRDRRAYMLCDRGCLRKDPNFQPCPGYAPAKTYTLPELRARARRSSAC